MNVFMKQIEAIEERMDELRKVERQGESPEHVIAAASALQLSRAIYEVGGMILVALHRIEHRVGRM
jgi:hypothetical protein